MIYIASLSLFADLFYYVIGIAASLGLRLRRPELNRPYRAPWIWVGAPLSVAIYIVMMTQLDREAFWTGALWCVLGLVVFYACRGLYGSVRDEAADEEILAVETPSPSEKAAMDREFRLWRLVTAVAVLVSAMLYVLPTALGFR